MSKKPIIVNLFGAPGAGKSTGAAYVFSKLKMAGMNVELVTEYAKDKVWEGNEEVFKPENQCYIFGKQFYRLNRCADKVDVIITDSPLVLSILYNKSDILGEDFNKMIMSCYNSFTNLAYFLSRDKEYNPVGRHQSEKESDELGNKLLLLLKERNIPFTSKPGNTYSYNEIVSDVLKLTDFKTPTTIN